MRNGNGGRRNQDNFGRPMKVIGLRDKNGKGFAAGILMIGNTAYKCTVSDASKDGVDKWLEVVKLPPKGKSQGSSF